VANGAPWTTLVSALQQRASVYWVPPFVEKLFSRVMGAVQLRRVTYLRNTAVAARIAAACYEWREECGL
jgi:hypothetical protein